MEDKTEAKRKTYYGYTEAKKKANAKYKSKFVEMRVRMTPERMQYVKDWLGENGAVSLSSWVNSLIDQAIMEAGGNPPTA